MSHTPFVYRFVFCLLTFVFAVGHLDAELVMRIGSNGARRVIDTDKQPLEPAPKAAPIQLNAVHITYQVTFRDVVLDNNIGFDDPALGATRRATFMAVLDYIDLFILNTGTLQIQVEPALTGGASALGFGEALYTLNTTYSDSYAVRHMKTNIDPDVSGPDIYVTIDFGYNYESGNATPEFNEVDLFSVLLHEVTHGIGMVTFADASGQGNPPGFLSRYDDFLYTGTGQKLWNAAGNPNGPSSNVTGGAGGVFFRGPKAVAEYGGFLPVHTPGTFTPGGSLSHWNIGIAGPEPVMTSTIIFGDMKRSYQNYEVGMLGDLGLTTALNNAAQHWEFYE